EGITVIGLEQAVAAPFATRQLADLGARVIKIERPGVGEFARGYDTTVRGLASYFVWLNRSKESLTLDLKRPEAQHILHHLIADIAAGMYAYAGILTALYRRERTGAGTAFEVSLFEALGEWMSAPAYYTAYGGSPSPRTGAMHATIAPYGPFPTGDGRTVFLGLQNEREWARFCAVVLERAELAADARFDANYKR